MRAEDRNVVKLLQGANPASNDKQVLPNASLYASDEKHADWHDVEAASIPRSQTKACQWRKWTSRVILALGLLSLLRVGSALVSLSTLPRESPATTDICPQVPVISPSSNAALLQDIEADVKNASSRLAIYEALGGAVRIPSVLPTF